jgi:periplasmic divalent cation tolerance protein
MEGVDVCEVQVAVGDHEAALTLARTAVEERLAACAQVSGPIWSVYRWREEVEETEEWLVTFKTRASLYPVLEKHINEHHSYEVPEILCLAVTQGNPDYLTWVYESTDIEDRRFG